MNTSMRNRSIVALLVAGFIVSAAPVAAQAYGPLYGSPQAVGNADSGDVVLRRDGTKSTTFVADVSSAPVLRRDGTKSTTFVADVGPEATASGGDFDWGDASVGAAAGLLIAAIAVAGFAAIRGRPAGAPASTRAASQAQGI